MIPDDDWHGAAGNEPVMSRGGFVLLVIGLLVLIALAGLGMAALSSGWGM